MVHPFLVLLAISFWFVAPAYAANSSPPLMRGKRPLDRGTTLHGHRLLDDGKTVEGSLGGIAFGIGFGLLLVALQPAIDNVLIAEQAGFSLSFHTPLLVVLLSVGAIFGDIVGAFVKRRLGIERGKPALLLDQLDFLVFAFLFASFVFIPSYSVLAVLIILTPPIHWCANLLGYSMKVKQTPW